MAVGGGDGEVGAAGGPSARGPSAGGASGCGAGPGGRGEVSGDQQDGPGAEGQGHDDRGQARAPELLPPPDPVRPNCRVKAGEGAAKSAKFVA